MFIEQIIVIDEKISNSFVNKYSDNRVVSFISTVGNIYYMVAFFTILAFISEWGKFNCMFVAVVSFFLSTLIVFILKFTVKRKRKDYGKSRFLKDIDPYSFPSGHVSRITAIFAPFYLVDTVFILVAVLISVMVSFARISRGYHYLSDCISGILIGFLSSWISIVIFCIAGMSVPFC